MRAESWLFTIEGDQDSALKVGDGFDVWTEPPRLRRTGAIRRRNDGDPYTPAWDIADKVVVFHPGSGRCWAILRVSGPAEWREKEEVFWTDTEIIALKRPGPTLSQIGINVALQGGRHRISVAQRQAAERLLR